MAQIELLKPKFFGSERGGLCIHLPDQQPPNIGDFDRAVHLTLPIRKRPGRRFSFRYMVFDEDCDRILIAFPPDISYPRAYRKIERSHLAGGNLRAAGRMVVDRRHDEPTIRTLIPLIQAHLLNMVLPPDNDKFVETILAHELGPEFKTLIQGTH